MSTRLLRLPQVCEQVGISRSQIYKLIASNRFPSPCRIGDRVSAWVSGDIETWIRSQIEERDQERQ